MSRAAAGPQRGAALTGPRTQVTTAHHADTSLVMVNAIAENVPMMAMVDLMMSFLAFSMPARMSFTSCTHTHAHTQQHQKGACPNLRPHASNTATSVCMSVNQSVRAGQQQCAVVPAHPVHLELKLHSLVTHVLQVISHAPACRDQHGMGWGGAGCQKTNQLTKPPQVLVSVAHYPLQGSRLVCVRHCTGPTNKVCARSLLTPPPPQSQQAHAADAQALLQRRRPAQQGLRSPLFQVEVQPLTGCELVDLVPHF